MVFCIEANAKKLILGTPSLINFPVDLNVTARVTARRVEVRVVNQSPERVVDILSAHLNIVAFGQRNRPRAIHVILDADGEAAARGAP